MGLDSVGAKARGLMRLAEVVNVPPFLVLTAETLSDACVDARTVRQRLDDAGLEPPFAVRSSSVEEDGVQDAFPGIFTTILGVAADDIFDAVRAVWKSGSSDRAQAYRMARGLGDERRGVSVIVQEIVHATVAGVAFSRHPTDSECVLLEAVRGLGEALVSGEASPDSLSIRRDDLSVVARDRGRQLVEVRPDGSHAMLHPRDVSAPKIDERDAQRIAATLLGIEDSFTDAPHGIDVEWALEGGELFFLQCRPITTTALSTGSA
jgi:pyruvate,water dikinase